jgi:hypothetical protein
VGGYVARGSRSDAWALERPAEVVRFFARDYPRWQKEWDVSLEERLSNTTKNFNARTAL